MNDLLVHCGGFEATNADIEAVCVPDATGSYVPVPYGRFIEEVELHVPRFGLEIQDQSFALARDGNQMFGVIRCTGGEDYCLAIGIRNSYDRSLSVGLIAGHHVFVCDNLAFTGEASLNRKHTVHVFRDLPDMIYQMLQRVSVVKDRQAGEIEKMKRIELDRLTVNNLIMETVRSKGLPASQVPKVLFEWEHPQYAAFEPRTAWSLFNAFTHVMRTRSPRAQMEDTLKLSSVFRGALRLN